MMTSREYAYAYVWVWLPDETNPIVAGKLTSEGEQIVFNYGQSYLGRDDAISLYNPELPLSDGILPLLNGLSMPGCIRDAAPDAWGRRVIMNRKLGLKGQQVDSAQLNEMTYLLESGSDRIGALDFQLSATEYVPRTHKNVSYDELLESAELVEKGIPLTPELSEALQHGTSIGGARPKALIDEGDRKHIAKFSSTTDTYSVVKAEYVAMRLAELTGLDVAKVRLEKSSNKDVLLIERFDRIKSDKGYQRKIMVSALTLLGLDEMLARYASYEQLAEIIRYRFTNASKTLMEVFSRMTFNVLCGNTDDHARNHAAFWDGDMLTLTKAYDICPQSRTGNEATQCMRISGDNNLSRLSVCLSVAEKFLLSEKEARSIIDNQINVITDNWESVCSEADLSETEKNLFWGRQFLNPYVLEGYRRS